MCVTISTVILIIVETIYENDPDFITNEKIYWMGIYANLYINKILNNIKFNQKNIYNIYF